MGNIFYLLISIDTKKNHLLLDILRKRLAKGEITQEQFESIKATLKLKEENINMRKTILSLILITSSILQWKGKL
ncbi:MAG: SHOCT domain-containing protein [Arcobacter sp.]|nr:SHOCT domain-containing protein [Arcobacter sp.]